MIMKLMFGCEEDDMYVIDCVLWNGGDFNSCELKYFNMLLYIVVFNNNLVLLKWMLWFIGVFGGYGY